MEQRVYVRAMHFGFYFSFILYLSHFLFSNRSKTVGDARVAKMNARDTLLEQLKKETLEKLAAFCKGPQYPGYLKKLIVQGLIKIEETNVEILARAEDKATVARVLGEALSEYRSVMSAAGHTGARLNPNVTISDTPIPAKGCNGGVILTALNGRIVLNQTVDEYVLSNIVMKISCGSSNFYILFHTM